VRKINLAVFGVNEIPKKSLCKFVDDCGKKKNSEMSSKKERSYFYAGDAESTQNTEKIEARKAKCKEKRPRCGRRD
jgi:hypothetical protein